MDLCMADEFQGGFSHWTRRQQRERAKFYLGCNELESDWTWLLECIIKVSLFGEGDCKPSAHAELKTTLWGGVSQCAGKLRRMKWLFVR